MLCQFSFRNYLSYKAETVLDFQATSVPELSSGIILQEKASSLLPVGVVYGPNGGGKTNLLKALACFITTIVKPIVELEKNRTAVIIQKPVSCEPFLLDDESQNQPTDFQIYFRVNAKEYRFSLSLFHGEIESEALYWRNIGGKRTGLLYERKGSVIQTGAVLQKSNVNIQVNPKMPYLSFLAINYDIPVITEVVQWFEGSIIQSYAVTKPEENSVINDIAMKAQILKAFHDLDIDITDYRYAKEENRYYIQRTVRQKTFELPFECESDGTKKLIGILPMLLLALKEGRMVIVDELDAKLHPKLLKYLIRLFHRPEINKSGAQLLFSSHDVTTMKNDVFRRDEIWFASMNDAHESTIYSLYDIRDENDKHINNTAAYDKQYLEGRYGADPYLQNILGGEWE